MQFITKVLTFSGALGTVSGFAYTVNYFLSGEKLGDVLRVKGYTLLNFDTNSNFDKSIWDDIVKAYSNNEKKLNNKKITVSGSSVSQEQVNELKNECAKVILLDTYSLDVEILAEQFCVTPITIKDLVGKQTGIKVLDSTNSSDNNFWDTKINEYLDAKEDKRISGVPLEAINTITRDTNRTKLKEGCQGLEIAKTYEKDFHIKYNKFLQWCTSK